AAVRGDIDAAVSQGIPVICFDSDCPGSRRQTFTSVDNRRVGEALAIRLMEAAGGSREMEGEGAILSGQAGAPNPQERVAAARRTLIKYPRVRVLQTLFCDDREDLAIEKIRATMGKHPDLRGWVMVGGWPLFRTNALDSIHDFQRTRVI